MKPNISLDDDYNIVVIYGNNMVETDRGLHYMVVELMLGVGEAASAEEVTQQFVLKEEPA